MHEFYRREKVTFTFFTQKLRVIKRAEKSFPSKTVNEVSDVIVSGKNTDNITSDQKTTYNSLTLTLQKTLPYFKLTTPITV